MKVKTFFVIDGDLRLEITKTAKWYVVSSLDIQGLHTQGKTIEEAIENAHDAAKTLAEAREIMLKELSTAKTDKKSADKFRVPTKTRKTRQAVKA